MEKFSNAKVGEGVWSSIHGWGNIIGGAPVSTSRDIAVAFDDGAYIETFYYDGRLSKDDKYPTLFWNEFYIPTDEEDKKPFNLVKFLKENLVPKKFEIGEKNYTLCYDNCDKKFYININSDIQFPHQYFRHIEEEVLIELNKNHITLQQLRKAYEELGWL